MKQNVQLNLDRLAIVGSTLCALHCIAMPVILSVFPSSFTIFFQDERFHQLMVWFVIPSSLIAVFIGCRQHKDLKVLIGASLGLAIIVLTALFGHDYLGEQGEKIATVIGAILLAASHIRNYKLCRKNCANDIA